MNNYYKESYLNYINKGLSLVPDKFGGKGYALKGLNIHADRLPTEEECRTYADSLEESNVALMLGPVSGVVALDLDTDKPEIMAVIESLLPESPVEKKGSKGYTRFFKYTGQQTEMLKYNGQVILEVLAGGKKTTLPPSLHPNGSNYVWTSDKTLLDIDVDSLPVLPPMLIPHLSSKLKMELGSTEDSYGKVVNGRNDELSKQLGVLIEGQHTVDETLKLLIKHDKEVNETPLFTDPNEFRHTDAVSNALLFYSNHLNSINSKRFRDNSEYLSPVMQTVSDLDLLKESAGKKSIAVDEQKKLRDLEYTHVPTAIKNLCETLNKNSWVKQPDLTMGAVLSVVSVLCSRKFTFRGMSPNVYVCNISKSGCVDRGTEFFNGIEWKPIGDYVEGEDVLQYNEDLQSGELVKPLEYLKEPHKDMYEIKTPRGTINQVLTPGHRMMLFDQAGKQSIETTQEFVDKIESGKHNSNSAKIKTTFKFEPINKVDLSDDELRLQIAYCADGVNIDSKGSNQITVKREDKKQMLSDLLHKTSTPFTRSDYDTGYSRFYFNPPILTNTIPTRWATDLNMSQCKVVKEECLKWDGSIKSARLRFFSKHKTDVDTLQFIASRLGIRSTIGKDIREGRTTVYTLLFSRESTDLVSIGKKLSIRKVESPDGFKYCFRVPSDALILRRNDRIFVTKNTGKNAGLSFIKNTLINLGADRLLGTSDLVSDAGLMDALEVKPTLILPLDEVSGVLHTATKGGSDYNAKLGDLLTELYTCSNDRFLGRALAGQMVKGAVDRPNLVILGCTTPRGFKDSVSISSMEKGLLGRFLLFFGKDDTPASPVKKEAKISRDVLNQLQYLSTFRPPETDNLIQGRPQLVQELTITDDADKRLDEIFLELDKYRIDNQDDVTGPVAARLFQQMTKLVILSACITSNREMPIIKISDVEFGFYMITYLFDNFKNSIDGLIFSNHMEKEKAQLEQLINEKGPISRPELLRETAYLGSGKREGYLKELIESERVDIAQSRSEEGKVNIVYFKRGLNENN